jgi:hypothetical protein
MRCFKIYKRILVYDLNFRLNTVFYVFKYLLEGRGDFCSLSLFCVFPCLFMVCLVLNLANFGWHFVFLFD